MMEYTAVCHSVTAFSTNRFRQAPGVLTVYEYRHDTSQTQHPEYHDQVICDAVHLRPMSVRGLPDAFVDLRQLLEMRT